MRRVIQMLSVCMLAVAMSCAAEAKENGDEKEGKEENEVVVKFDQLPQAVQTTFKEEARGATIAEVDKETEDGEIAYEADVQIKGKTYEIKVAEDGTHVEVDGWRLVEDKFLELWHSGEATHCRLWIECRVKQEFQPFGLRIVTPSHSQFALCIAHCELTDCQPLISIESIQIKGMKTPVAASHFISRKLGLYEHRFRSRKVATETHIDHRSLAFQLQRPKFVDDPGGSVRG